MDGQGWTLTEAAAQLGISREALRKRVVRGRIAAHKNAEGVWLVDLPGEDRSPDMAVDSNVRVSGDLSDVGGTRPRAHLSPSGSDRSTPASQLGAVMAEWVTPLVDRIERQAERIGQLEAEKARLEALVAGQRRPWWRFWG